MKKIVIDAEFKALMPEITVSEYAELEKLILKDGCREPLSLWKNILIDGHNRYNICQEHNIKFSTVDIQLESREAVKIWMIRNQLGKRNLTDFQRVEIVVLLEENYRDKGKENMSKDDKKQPCLNSDKVDTKRELAKLADVSHDTYYRVKKIIEKASEKDKELLRKGDKKINEIFLKINLKEKKSKDPELFKQQIEFERQQVSFADSDKSFRGSKVKDKYQHLFKDRPDAYFLFFVLSELPERISKVDLPSFPEKKKGAMLEALLPALTAVKKCMTKTIEEFNQNKQQLN